MILNHSFITFHDQLLRHLITRVVGLIDCGALDCLKSRRCKLWIEIIRLFARVDMQS